MAKTTLPTITAQQQHEQPLPTVNDMSIAMEEENVEATDLTVTATRTRSPQQQLPFVNYKQLHVLNAHLWNGASKSTSLQQLKPQMLSAAREAIPPNERLAYLGAIYDTATLEPYTAWTGGETPGNFESTIEAATKRFNKTDIAALALERARTAEQPDLNVIAGNSFLFANDPIATLRSRAAMFANTRVSRHLLTDTIVETTKPQLQQRLLAIVDPLDPILAPTFQPNPAAATVRPQIAKLQSAITALA